MKNTNDYTLNCTKLFTCYLLWGFQPLYWQLLDGIDSLMLLGIRIVFAALFSVILLLVTGRQQELISVFRDRHTMKFLVPATVFLLADWAVFIYAIMSGHVIDTSLGYYICPLVIFAFGVILYREKTTGLQLAALGVAFVGVVVSTVSLGKLPLLSLVIAFNWAVYATVKKNVKVSGIVSIAAETLMLSPAAIVFLLFFRTQQLASADAFSWVFLVLSGVVTALPMFLYSDSVSVLPLIMVCFAQYLSPNFNLLCGLIMGESFSKSQIISLVFFIAAILLFTYSELKSAKKQ